MSKDYYYWLTLVNFIYWKNGHFLAVDDEFDMAKFFFEDGSTPEEFYEWMLTNA